MTAATPTLTPDRLRLGRTVSIDRAAQLLQVSRRTIYNRIADGRLRAVRTLGRSQRVLVASLSGVDARTQTSSFLPSPASFAARSLHRP